MTIDPAQVATSERDAVPVEEFEDLDRDLAAVVKLVAELRRGELAVGRALRQRRCNSRHLGDSRAQGSSASISIDWSSLPSLDDAFDLAQKGCVTGASHRNWASYGENVSLPADWPDWRRCLLTDPQTSGGLLVACAPDRAADIAAQIVADGYASARIIGRVAGGPAAVRVTA